MAKAASKKDAVIKYLQSHPDATLAQVAEACGTSVPTVSNAKRDAGLTRTSGDGASPQRARKRVGKSSATASVTTSEDGTEALRKAVEMAGGVSPLVAILEHVEGAGGVASVKASLDHYRRLQAIFGKGG